MTLATLMRHLINPLVDCVFKALLGDVKNTHLTVDFLNAIIKPAFPIQTIHILNPYNEKEFLDDKLTIVDIKAVDSEGNHYQIEVQLAVFSYLPARMLYTWSDIYRAELEGGENFNLLEPVVSIWLLGDNLFEDSEHHHHFQAYDPVNEVALSDHLAIHVLELAKWKPSSELLDKEDQWLCFFQQAKDWDRLPKALDNPEMRQAMQVLNRFSEKQRHYDLYQARVNAMREQSAKKQLLEKAEQQRQEAERLREEAEQREKEAQQQKEEAERREKEAQQQKDEAERREKEAQQQKDEAEQQKDEAERREKETKVKMCDAVREVETERSEKERLIALLQKAGIDSDKG